MIKWACYWKSLKLLFFGLLISCFTLLGNSFVSADDISHELPYNFYIDSNFESIYKDLNLESDWWNWLYKQYSNNAVRSIFWNNWRLYTYYYESSSSNYQWYFDKVCKVYSETWYLPSRWPICNDGSEFTTTWYNEFYNLQNPNFTKVVSPEVWNFNYYSPVLCFYDSITQYFYCFNLENHNWWSLNIVWRITDFSEYAEYSIFSNWNIWSSAINNNSVITWDFVYSECTVWQVKKFAEDSWLSPYVCYAWLNISYTWLQIWTAWTWSSVFELFQSTNDWKNFRDWFNYRDKIFDNRFVYSDTIRQDKPSALYSYFNFYNQYWPEFTSTDIENYCRIIVNNLSESSKRTWLSSRCPIISSSSISWDFNWDIAVWVNRNWVWNMSWNENSDPITFIQNFFNKVKSVIPTDFNWNTVWFLPTYIILFLCAIILFRFISH